jgi:hypothetical protein
MNGIALINEQRGHLARTNFAHQALELGIAPPLLKGRLFQVEGRTVVAQDMVQKVAEDLLVHDLTVAHDQAPLPVLPQAIDQVRQERFGDRRLVEVGPFKIDADSSRQPRAQVTHDQTHFTRTDEHPPVGLGAGEREPRLELHVVRRPGFGIVESPAGLVSGGKFHR